MKGIVNMKQYIAPEIDLLLINTEDILTESPGHDYYIYDGELD